MQRINAEEAFEFQFLFNTLSKPIENISVATATCVF